MSASKAAARLQRKVNPLDGQLSLGPMALENSQAPINFVDVPWIREVLVRALDETMSRKEAAILMGKDQAQVTRQLANGHLTWEDASKLGDDYWRNVHAGIGAHFDMLDRAELTAQGDRLMERARWFYAKAAMR